MTSTMKKGLGIIVVLVAGLACVLALAGCGGAPSKEDQAKEAFEAQMKQIQDGGLSEYMESSGQMVDLSTYGIDYTDLIDEVVENLSYTVDSAKEDSNGDVTLDVTVKSKQLVPAFLSAFKTVYDEAMETASNATSYSDISNIQNDMMARFGELVNEQFSSEEPTTTDCTVTMVETNGKWDFDTTSGTALSEAIIGNYTDLSSEISSIASSALSSIG